MKLSLFLFLYSTRKTNSGQNGVWVYEIGSSPFFAAITPGMVNNLPDEDNATTTEPPVTMLPPEEPTVVPEKKFPTETTTEYPEVETTTPGFAEQETTEPDYPAYEDETFTPTYTEPERAPTRYPSQPRYPDRSEPRYPDPSQPRYPDISEPRYPDQSQPRYPDSSEPRYPDRTETRYPISEPLPPRYTIPETTEPRYPPVEPRYPDPDPVQPRYTNPEPVQPLPPHSRPQQPQIVVVDEDLDVNGKSQKLKALFFLGTLFIFTEPDRFVLFLFSQYFRTIRRRAPTTGTNARLSQTAGITATGTAAIVGLVSMATGRTVSQKVRSIFVVTQNYLS